MSVGQVRGPIARQEFSVGTTVVRLAGVTGGGGVTVNVLNNSFSIATVGMEHLLELDATVIGYGANFTIQIQIFNLSTLAVLQQFDVPISTGYVNQEVNLPFIITPLVALDEYQIRVVVPQNAPGPIAMQFDAGPTFTPEVMVTVSEFGAAVNVCATLLVSGTVEMATQVETINTAVLPGDAPTLGATGCPLVPSPRNLLLRQEAASTALFTVNSVGANPVVGFGTQALDLQSYRTVAAEIASGYQSVAVGSRCRANTTRAVAMGFGCTAGGGIGAQTTAVGVYSTAQGYRSCAFGRGNLASGASSIAMGLFSVSGGASSLAVGRICYASAAYTSVIGYRSTAPIGATNATLFGRSNFASATSLSAVAVGVMNNVATPGNISSLTGVIVGDPQAANATIGIASTAVGVANRAQGLCSTAIGFRNQAATIDSLAVGYSNVASGLDGQAVGYTNAASGNYSAAFGFSNTSSGLRSAAFGQHCVAAAIDSSVFGWYSTATAGSTNSVILGRSNFSSATSLSAVAVGVMNNVATPGNLANATGVISGDPQSANATIGINSTAVGVANLAQGLQSTAVGFKNVASGIFASAFGHLNTASGYYASALGADNLATATTSQGVGSFNWAFGRRSSAFGFSNVADGGVAANSGNCVAFGRSNFTNVTSVSAVAVGVMNNVATPANLANATGLITDPQTANATIGINSTAVGVANLAQTLRSVAMGFKNLCSGGYSNNSAVGTYNTASSVRACAFGHANTASGAAGQAFGHGNLASGSSYSNAFGRGNTASGTQSSAFGNFNSATSSGATSFGYLNVAAGATSVAFGFKNDCPIGSTNCVAMGRSNFASGTSLSSVAVGLMNNVATPGNLANATGVISGDPQTANATIGINSSAIGVANLAQGTTSVAVGFKNVASGNFSVALGNGCTASAYGAIAVGRACSTTTSASMCFGYGSSSSGGSSLAVGRTDTAAATYSAAMGFGNTCTAGSTNSLCVGRSNFSSATSLSAVSVGVMNNVATVANLANATGVISGDPQSANATIGINSTAVGVGNLAQSLRSVAVGFKNTASTNNTAIAMGAYNTATGLNSQAVGWSNSATGLRGVAFGYSSSSGTGSRNVAMGNNASCGSVSDVVAMGKDITTGGSGTGSVGIGRNITLSAPNGVAVGYTCSVGAGADNAVAMGRSNFTVGGDSCVSIGLMNNVATPGNLNLGTGVIAGDPQTAAASIGIVSCALGVVNAAPGIHSVAVGLQNVADGGVAATGGNCVAVGRTNFTNVTSISAVALGVMNNVATPANLASGTGLITEPNAANATIGINSTAVGVVNLSPGLRSVAVGFGNVADGGVAVGGGNAVAIGRSNFTNVTSVSAVATGVMCNAATPSNLNDTTGVISGDPQTANATIGINSSAIGVACQAQALKSNAFGFKAVSRVINTTVINGAQIVRRDDIAAIAAADKFLFYCGTEVVLVTEEFDFLTAADTEIALPANCRWWNKNLAVFVTEQTGGAIVTQPTVRFGNAAAPANQIAAVLTTLLTAVGQMQDFNTPLLPQDGQTSASNLSAGVTIVAVLAAAGTYKGRFVFRGLLVENE